LPDQIEKISASPDLGRVEDGHDLMERRSEELSGMGSTDCGTVGIRENPQRATKCALRVFSEGKPFHVRYDLMGIDSDVAEGIVGSAGGQVYELDFDGDPAGHEGTSRARQWVGVRNCPTPVHLWVNSDGRLECFGSKQHRLNKKVGFPGRRPNGRLRKRQRSGWRCE
jgi:hypothetical protein